MVSSNSGAASSDWIEVRSQNFTVYTNGGQKAGERLAWQFERIRGVFKKQWSWARVDGPEPTVIIGAKDEKTTQSFLPYFWELKNGSRPAGMSIAGPDRHLLLVRLDASGGENPYHVLYHEYTHRVLALNFAWLPVWLNEGMAEFFGSTEIDDTTVRQGQPRPEVIQFLRDARLMDLEKFFAVDPTSPEYNEATRATVFYAQAWVLVHYLILGDKGAHGEQLNTFIRDIAAGISEEEARTRVFGDPKALQVALRKYVSQPSFFYRKIEDLIDVPPREFKIRALGEAEALARRADVLGRTGQAPLAEEAIEKGLRAEGGGDLPILLDLKAQMLLAKQKKEEAKDLFAAAEKLGSRDFYAAYLAGNLATGDQELNPEAERLYRRSIELNLQSSLAPFMLGAWLAGSKGREAESFQWLKRAAELSPQNLPLQMKIAESLHLIDRTDEARSIAERIGTISRGPLREAADAFLEKAIPKAADKRLAFHLRRCESGNGQGCTAAGHMVADGVVGARDEPRAFEIFRRACNLKDSGGCDQFGWRLELGKGVAKDVTQALAIYETNCPHSTWACAAIADRLWKGSDDVAKDGPRASAFAQKACDGKSGWGCDLLGTLHLNGEGVPKDPARSLRLFEESCELGYATGCFDLAESFRSGRGTEASQEKAVAAYQKACDTRHAEACATLGDLFSSGEGASTDFSRAAGAYETACDRGDSPSCDELGILYMVGRGVSKDEWRAEELFKKSCDGAYGPGCYSLGQAAYPKKEFVSSLALYEKACKLKFQAGCRMVANQMIRGEGTDRDPSRAAQILEAACGEKDMSSCFGLAGLFGAGLGVPRDVEKAHALATKACDGGFKLACDAVSGKDLGTGPVPSAVIDACEAKDPNACVALGGILFYRGEFVQAAPALQVACEAGHAWSCSQLATAYLLGGRGVPKDAKRAKVLFQRACADKETSACEALRLLR